MNLQGLHSRTDTHSLLPQVAVEPHLRNEARGGVAHAVLLHQRQARWVVHGVALVAPRPAQRPPERAAIKRLLGSSAVAVAAGPLKQLLRSLCAWRQPQESNLRADTTKSRAGWCAAVQSRSAVQLLGDTSSSFTACLLSHLRLPAPAMHAAAAWRRAARPGFAALPDFRAVQTSLMCWRPGRRTESVELASLLLHRKDQDPADGCGTADTVRVRHTLTTGHGWVASGVLSQDV